MAGLWERTWERRLGAQGGGAVAGGGGRLLVEQVRGHLDRLGAGDEDVPPAGDATVERQLVVHLVGPGGDPRRDLVDVLLELVGRHEVDHLGDVQRLLVPRDHADQQRDGERRGRARLAEDHELGLLRRLLRVLAVVLVSELRDVPARVAPRGLVVERPDRDVPLPDELVDVPVVAGDLDPHGCTFLVFCKAPCLALQGVMMPRAWWRSSRSRKVIMWISVAVDLSRRDECGV